MRKFRGRFVLSIMAIGLLIFSVLNAGSALGADEGYIISKDPNYSTNDLVFDRNLDTIYMKLWSSVVGDSPKSTKWTITDSSDHKESDSFSADGYSVGGTLTFVANVQASNFAPGSASLAMQLQAGKNKYKVTQAITITGGSSNQAPPSPSWIDPDSTDDNTPHITWESVIDPDGDTVQYSIMIGSTSGSSDVLQETSTGTNTFYDVTSALNDGTYYVNVRSNDGSFFSSWHEETMIIDTSGGSPPTPELDVTSCFVDDISNTNCYNALSADGGTSYSLSKVTHIDAPFEVVSGVAVVNSATLYYDSWGSLSGSWGIYLKDARDGSVICSADPAPESGSETRNSINCNGLTPAQLENGVWLYIKNDDDKKPDPINLDHVYLYVDYILFSSITEMWVDDDYTPASCGGHTWDVDAFDRVQTAIYRANDDTNTKINIQAGTYYEQLIIDKPVNLVGEIINEDWATTIDGTIGNKWALICVSANDMGESDQNPDRDCFPAQGLEAYYTLKGLGYDDNHIVLMLWHDDEGTYEDESNNVICEDNPNTVQVENDGDIIDEWININYFTPGNWLNELYGPDGIQGNTDDPIIDVDNRAVTKAALQQQITNLAGQVTKDDSFLFYVVNHGRLYGTPEKCQIYFEDDSAGTAGQYLDATTLDSWLDQIECKRMDILIDMCRTKNFLDSAPGLYAEPNRLILGAAGDIEDIAHAWYQARYDHPTDGSHFAGSWFFNPFWSRLDAGDTVQQAYQYAIEESDEMAENHPYPYQYPFLLDKVRDVDEYSAIPYTCDVITILNGAGDGAEIKNCSITNGRTGINAKNNNVATGQALINDASVGFTDVSTNANNDDDLYFNFFPSSQAVSSDSFMIGATEIFTRLNVQLSPGGSGTGGSFVVECAVDRDTWTAVELQTDTTNGLTQTGDIIFKPPLEWAYQAHIHSVSDVKSEYSFWVRLRLVNTYTTMPSGDFISLSYFSDGAKNITNCNIQGNTFGIKLTGMATQQTGIGAISDWIMTDNQIKLNNYGIYLELCNGMDIYHNNFIDNTNQVYDSNPTQNNWYNTVSLEGNHWSNYIGVDDGSGTGKHAIAGDGIGDTLLPHPGTDYDLYPFIATNGWMS